MAKIFISILLIFCFIFVCVCTKNFQAVHVLDPTSPNHTSYESWNSDKWIKWLRGRYEDDIRERRKITQESDGTPVNNSDEALYGTWANIIVVASLEEIEDAFTQNSLKAYTIGDREDYFWSDIPFPVFVILRGPKGNGTLLNVYNCSQKKMYINAKLDMDTFKPVELKTFFPKQVKNPGEKLRVPLVVCKKVLQVRGLIDEIDFLLRSSKPKENTDLDETITETK